MAGSATHWQLDGTNIAVLADCHIHPGGGPAFPDSLFDALQGADLIVTLGDMGEAAGLDQLAEIAPVIGVRGQDDSDDPRTDQTALVLRGRGMDIGCIFDAVGAGLATTSDPFAPSAAFNAVAKQVFGVPVQMLLFASTHRAGAGQFGDSGMALNPGSAVLPAEGERPSMLRLLVSDGGSFSGEIIPLD
jgi:predicted phosphodiesterase